MTNPDGKWRGSVPTAITSTLDPLPTRIVTSSRPTVHTPRRLPTVLPLSGGAFIDTSFSVDGLQVHAHHCILDARCCSVATEQAPSRPVSLPARSHGPLQPGLIHQQRSCTADWCCRTADVAARQRRGTMEENRAENSKRRLEPDDTAVARGRRSLHSRRLRVDTPAPR